MWTWGYLGNFLSGMETLAVVVVEALRDALETSLVEWKLHPDGLPGGFISSLGNFLSGMETDVVGMCLRGLYRLGNFLSGMETRNKGVLVAALPSPWKLP